MPDPTDPHPVADDPSGIVQQMPETAWDVLEELRVRITKGPWEARADHPLNACANVRTRDEGWEVATLYGGGETARQDADGVWGPHPERDATARAIAMLPDLLDEVIARRTTEADLRAEVERLRGLSKAAQDVMAERHRQISDEGWTPELDDCHDRSEMAQAAACYALSGTPVDESLFIHGRWKDPRDLFWPWSPEWWKPTGRRRDLVKAGALILAEIERLDRAALSPETDGGQDD
ncbi:hypothetical protein A6J80_17185 [Paracoccus yeei]|uniref:Uncharacterized protein n=1 Tax=Paracoccus yeei TaxID=147645 RepID=A0A1V0GVN8_9RHOB|nr:hypothetical protein [Paracoccus yeei]ARC37850.1 hypothetical protein A6J80_17185 [Paracoccus yeei]